MSGCDLLAVRLNRRPTGLERMLGLLRNQYSEVPQISPAVDGDGSIQVLLPLAGCRIPVERLAEELRTLHDVLEVRGVFSTEGVVRQLAFAHVSRVGTVVSELPGQVVAQGDHASVLELTGSPSEIDEALERLRCLGVLLGAKKVGLILLDVDQYAGSATVLKRGVVGQADQGALL